MAKPGRQKSNAAQKKRNRRSNNLLLIGLAAGVLIVAGIIFLSSRTSPADSSLVGEAVAIPSRDHVPSDTVPGPYNSNPPAGGTHFDTDYSEKFFQEGDLANLPPHPEGYLVHSLEHGYVIFWYNCQVPNTDCTALKKTIQQVMEKTGNTKLIAFPWATMDVPLAMTSWGRILKFTQPDPVLMEKFVTNNRYQAPEPDAP